MKNRKNKAMKNYKTYTINWMVLVLLIVLSSCEKDFLEEDLRSGLSPTGFYNNLNEAQMAVNGVYATLNNQNLYRNRNYRGAVQYGSDEVCPQRKVIQTPYNYLYTEGNGDLHAAWKEFYLLIRNANSAIANISTAEALTVEEKNQLLGELYVLRAMAYYDLTCVWNDVPFFTEILAPEELASLERTPAQTIRDAMIADLQTAYGLLPDSWSGPDLGRMSKWAARALEAKFHMFSKNWQGMLTACKDIIDNSPHRLMDDFGDIFDWTNSGYTNTFLVGVIQPNPHRVGIG